MMGTSRAAYAIDPAVIQEVAALLAASSSVLFITGAGISADSGLPTYRGIGGLYEDAHTEEGIPIEVALSGSMLRTRPEITWKYIALVEAACRGARFNGAHTVIAELEKRLPRVWVLTQNVDGFHRDAGSQKLIEMHGNVHRLMCTQCAWRGTVPDFSTLTMPPQCERCGALIRPDVVLFGERLPAAAVTQNAIQLQRGFDVVFSIGTSSGFPYIAGPVVSAHRAGVPTVEINPGETEISSHAQYRIRAGAKQALEALWAAYVTVAGQ
jgi:NAD-dependent deacetylase